MVEISKNAIFRTNQTNLSKLARKKEWWDASFKI
jgi:hypothetical protein